jgi:hypothetical protein
MVIGAVVVAMGLLLLPLYAILATILKLSGIN